jgi:tetratricopeptide (TPR) repeat protein
MSRHDQVATHVNRGILRLRRGLAEAAIADFDEAIQLDPQQPEAYLNKGAALIRLNNPSEALGLFTVALEHNTRRPEIAFFGRAIANETLGNIRQAYQDYRRASELSPTWQDPQTELARFRVVED